ncbi:hypothetical protein ONS96_013568 [Cadophora gregata f. sp. sojae]|nr:hypothetical protein ONS96_013568 [Cadophora gregata f. sp. sojae]
MGSPHDMRSKPLPIKGVSEARGFGDPDPRTITLPAHIREDLAYSRDIEMSNLQVKCCRLPVSKGGLVLQSGTKEDFAKRLNVIENPGTGRFVSGTTCLALARSDDSVVPNRYHYSILSLHHLRRFAIEYELDPEHFELMDDLLNEAQSLCDKIRREARARNPPFQEALDALEKWRQGQYILNLHDEEESISPVSSDKSTCSDPSDRQYDDENLLFPFSPHEDVTADPLSSQMLLEASQVTLVNPITVYAIDVAASPKETGGETREGEIINTVYPQSPDKSVILNGHENSKLQNKDSQGGSLIHRAMRESLDGGESPKMVEERMVAEAIAEPKTSGAASQVLNGYMDTLELQNKLEGTQKVNKWLSNCND